METVLRKHRGMARLTLRALAAETGIAFSRLSRMENRKEELWRGDISRLRKALPTLENVEFVGADRLAM
jgi:transcriptional regulator with XRE-family HTH domain